VRTWKIQRRADDETALRNLGLSSSPLLESVSIGLSAAELVDFARDPRILRGIWVWGKIFGALCGALQPDGWRKVEKMNWPRMINADGSVAIAVMAGDENTGAGPSARPKYRRGPMAIVAVAVNQLCLELGDATQKAAQVSDAELLRTYFLLYRRTADAIHVQLALPSEMKNGAVVTWAECINVGTLELVTVDEEAADAGRAFDVPVEEKPGEEE